MLKFCYDTDKGDEAFAETYRFLIKPSQIWQTKDGFTNETVTNIDMRHIFSESYIECTWDEEKWSCRNLQNLKNWKSKIFQNELI